MPTPVLKKSAPETFTTARHSIFDQLVEEVEKAAAEIAGEQSAVANWMRGQKESGQVGLFGFFAEGAQSLVQTLKDGLKISDTDVDGIRGVFSEPAITGDKNLDHFLSELDIDKSEWERAKASGTEGALISEKLRDEDCKVHPELGRALHSFESWIEDNSPYKNPESFRRDLIKAYVAGINAHTPGEASKLVTDAMEKHLKAENLEEAELKRARGIIDRVEKAAEKERREREGIEKKGI